MADPEPAEEAYQPQDAIASGTRGALVVGSAGLLLSAVQNTMAKTNVGTMGVITKFGGTTTLFASVGGVYAFVSTATANLREKEDMVSHATGGFFGGAMLGLPKRAMTSVLGHGMAAAGLMAVMAFTSKNLKITQEEAEEERLAKKYEVRKRFRRPLNETVNEIGEGRGIYPPGYDERRKQRIKDNYGIEIQEPYYKSEPTSN